MLQGLPSAAMTEASIDQWSKCRLYRWTYVNITSEFLYRQI
jgi:hypothetical protein